jgi:leukotriene-A4 hydrolase
LKNIHILKVKQDSNELDFKITSPKGEDYPLGTPLEIYLKNPVGISQEFSLIISFKTTNRSEAIQWLTKSQTIGKKYPFMFTQCQAILCRGLIPCQVAKL